MIGAALLEGRDAKKHKKPRRASARLRLRTGRRAVGVNTTPATGIRQRDVAHRVGCGENGNAAIGTRSRRRKTSAWPYSEFETPS